MDGVSKIGQQRGWTDAQEVNQRNKDKIAQYCLSVLAKMPRFDWGLYTNMLSQIGYDVKLQSDSKGQVRGYSVKRGNSIYKSSELGKRRCLMPSKLEQTWAKLHPQERNNTVSRSPRQSQNTQPKNVVATAKPMHTEDNTSKMGHFDFSTDEFHHYPVDIPQPCLDVIDKNIALDAATTIAAQSGGGATSGWGRDKDEDELSWAYRCAIMANRLCSPRKKRGLGR